MRELKKRYLDKLVIVAFPTMEFGRMEHTREDVNLQKEFAVKHGPSDLILLQTKKLTDRPAWWQQVVPEWNFRGKWLIDPHGQRKVTETASIYEDIDTMLTTKN